MYIFTKVIKQVILPLLIIGMVDMEAQARQQDSLAISVQDSIRRANDTRQKATGTITDASTGKPLNGINISVAGFSASITDDKGSFSIPVPNYSAVLIISGEGFQTKEIALRGKNFVTAALYEDTFHSIYDVVGLPFSKKLGNQTTGAVSSLNISDNWQRSNEGPDTYLQGRVTGLSATRRSGTPGIGASIFLRGYNSLYTSNQPLYIIDGIYYDNNDYGSSLISGHVENPLANIDLKDVDNITVIKDATASVYGTKAANGVILITTARAKEQATKIDFSAYGGYNFKPSNIPVMNAAGYRTYLSDALGEYATRLGMNASQAQTFIQSQPYMNDDTSNPNYYRYHSDTNWQNQVLKDSYNQNYYLKVTGGDNIATYGLTVGYLKNQGVIKNTDQIRYQTRFNADLNLTNKLKGVANLSFVSNEQNLVNQGLSNNTNPLFLALTKAPFLPVNEVSDLGEESPNYAGADIFGKSNPVVAVDKIIGSNKNYRFLGSVGFNYEFNKQLNLQVLGGVTFSKVRENSFIPEKGIVVDTLSQGIVRNRSGANVERLYSIFTDTRLGYSKIFNNTHELSANIGVRFNDNKSESDMGQGFNAATDDYVTVGNGQASLRRISGENGLWRSLNTYINADYAFKHKYFLSLNMAVDASSRFGTTIPNAFTVGGNNMAVMPSVAAAWLLSSENFLANNNFIEVLKLRASYGLVGNDDIGNYTAKQYYVSQNFLGSQGLVRGNIANTSLKWETVKKANLGIDAAFLNERINLSIDLFKNITDDMLTQETVSTVTGFDFGFSNAGGMSTKGIEVGLNARILRKSLKWDLGINVSAYRNEITRIPGDRRLTNFAGATILTETGRPGNLFYGYKTNGVYTSDAEVSASNLAVRRPDGTIIALQGGDMKFIDTNGDKFIDESDRQVIGNPNPDFTGMVSNTLSWKRVSFDAILTFSQGNEVYNYMRRNLESQDGFQNQAPVVMNRWRASGQVTNIPRASIQDPAGNARFSDRWIEDGSYLRLRTISLTYDVPMKARALKYIKVYLTGNNVFTLSKYLGYDPEFSATGSVFTQGIDIGLEPQFRTTQLGVRIGL